MNFCWVIVVAALCNAGAAAHVEFISLHQRHNHHDKSNRSLLADPRISEDIQSVEKNSGIRLYVSLTGATDLSSAEHKKMRSKNSNVEHFMNSAVRFRRSLVSGNLMINQHYNEKLISPGEDVSLQCTASADRPPRFIWERDGVVLTSNTDSRYIGGCDSIAREGYKQIKTPFAFLYRITYQCYNRYILGQMMSPIGVGVIAQLNISRPRIEDGGLYSCVAYEGEASVKYSARINIYGPPYIRTLPPIKVQSGEALKLRCPYYGYPISKLEWEHKGKKIVSSTLPQHLRYKRTDTYSRIYTRKRRRKRQVMETNEDGVLNIHRVLKEENGETYTCIVYSPSGEMARRSFEIQVVEAPELDELRVGSGLKEGQIVQITCNIISGDPPIFFSWLKDSMKIPASLKITERSSELFSVLIIKRVSLEHCGRYTCIATNHVGKVNQTTDLFINVAPKWVEEPTNSSLLLGQRGVVDCNANGYPVPQIHWMKRDASLGIWRPILDLAGGGVSSYPNGSLSLEVVSLADEGEYACHVNNGFGEPLHKNLWINVNKPVHFESLGMNLTTKMGLPVTLTCQPLGDSPIRIKWSLDGKPVEYSTSRATLSESTSSVGMTSVLSIHHVESRDGGAYECRASNPYGVSTFNIHLNILEPPVPPKHLEVDYVSSSTALIFWTDTMVSHVQYYSVQYSSNHYTMWDSAKVINKTRKNNNLRQSILLRDLQPSLEYRVRVAAGNLVDLSPYTQPVLFTTLQEAPSSSPLGVQAQQTDNPGELLISWIPPSRESHNGPLQGYHVKAVPRISGESGPNDTQTKMVKVTPRNGKHETVLSGLLKNTRYGVSVSAFNSAGNGPFSSPVYQTTREGAPEEAVSGLQCGGTAAGALRVSWPPLAPRAASLLGYVLLYWTEDGPWLNMTTPQSEIYLQGLQKYTNYTIKVAGFSNYGVGPFSYPIVCTTLQDVPGAPAVIKALASSPTSLIVSWKVPDEPNGEITHYTVYVKPVSSTSAPQSYRVEPTQDSLVTRQLMYPLSGLTTGQQYEVFVRAHTGAGEGAPSSRVHVELTNKVVAGVWSLGGRVWAGAGGALRLACAGAGSPPPRALWYHDQNIITHHPRFSRHADGSLLVQNIDQSLSGNYTCIAKNLYGSDSVSYEVMVLPTPEPPVLRATPYKSALLLQWDQPRKVAGKPQKISYELMWKEVEPFQDTWVDKRTSIQGVQEYTLEGLKCGTKYSITMTASNSVGSSAPTQLDVSTLGGTPKPPTTTEWFWSNASHIFIQLSGWDDNGCEITRWEVQYKEFGGKWKTLNIQPTLTDPTWTDYSSSILSQPYSLVLDGLSPAQWYRLRIYSENSAGTVVSVYSYATTTLLGASIGPPSDNVDVNVVVMICSTVLLVICTPTFIYVCVKRYKQDRLAYRNALAMESKSERSNATANTPQSIPADAGRVYSTPVHLTAENKHELYEISPYAQFAIGFRTFGHVDNQEAPSRVHLPGNSKARYDSETSFQMRSESEESDCVSRTTTLKSAPRKACRIPHHR